MSESLYLISKADRDLDEIEKATFRGVGNAGKEFFNARRQVGMIAGPEKAAMRRATKQAAGGGTIGSFRQSFKATRSGQGAAYNAKVKEAGLNALSPERRKLVAARTSVAQNRIQRYVS